MTTLNPTPQHPTLKTTINIFFYTLPHSLPISHGPFHPDGATATTATDLSLPTPHGPFQPGALLPLLLLTSASLHPTAPSSQVALLLLLLLTSASLHPTTPSSQVALLPLLLLTSALTCVRSCAMLSDRPPASRLAFCASDTRAWEEATDACGVGRGMAGQGGVGQSWAEEGR